MITTIKDTDPNPTRIFIMTALASTDKKLGSANKTCTRKMHSHRNIHNT